MNKTPIYIFPAEYAMEHCELEIYRASSKADIACKKAIEEAIQRHYHDNRLDPACVIQVVEAFGFERVMRVLANTVRQKDWDGRISRDNKAWSHTVPIYPNKDDRGMDRNIRFVVESHPGLTNLFISQVRRAYAKAQEKAESRESVLTKLQRPLAKATSAASIKEPEL